MTQDSFRGAVSILKPIGFAVFGLGMGLFACAALFLKRAFGGNVRPVTEDLIRAGPYKLVRHPLYLGMLIAITGLAVGMRSLWGLVLAYGLFVPLTVLRARLEEAALRARFGREWEEYSNRTYFLLPPVY